MTNNLARVSEEKISPETLPPNEERADIVVPVPLSAETQHRLVESRQQLSLYSLTAKQIQT